MRELLYVVLSSRAGLTHVVTFACVRTGRCGSDNDAFVITSSILKRRNTHEAEPMLTSVLGSEESSENSTGKFEVVGQQ